MSHLATMRMVGRSNLLVCSVKATTINFLLLLIETFCCPLVNMDQQPEQTQAICRVESLVQC
jgi:hypothetical protein